MESRVWFTWETQRRNKELAEALGCRYARFDYGHLGALRRYLVSSWRTRRELRRGAYRQVFAQCPSIVLCALLGALKRGRGFQLILDVHNVIFEQARQGGPLAALIRFSFRQADWVIVSNRHLFAEAEALGGRALVLPDRIPAIAPRDLPARFAHAQRPLITLISTFAADEPIETFLGAVLEVDRPFSLLVTGRRSKARDLLRHESERIRFTDFLPEADFEGLIQHSDLLVDLTTRAHCLVCGAYEALSVGVPALVSDSDVNRETFGEGYLYARNEREEYRRQIEAFLADPGALRAPIRAFRAVFERRWQSQLEALARAIERPAPEPAPAGETVGP